MTEPFATSERPPLLPSDRDLLAAYARAGDEKAFAAVVERHVGLVTGIALRRTGDAHLAEEVAQTTFSILARKAASLHGITSLAAWLHRVAIVQSLRALRQLVRHRRKLELAMHHADSHLDTSDPYEEALPWLDEALEELPESDRQLLLLRYYERLSFVDISKRLGRSEVALRQRAGRAVERLSGRLRRRGIAVPAAAITGSLGISLAGPQASAASAILLARAALATAPGLTAAALWFTSFLTMSTTKSIGLAAAAALILGSIPLAWQHFETTRLKAEIRVADEPDRKVAVGARVPLPGPPGTSPRPVGPPVSGSGSSGLAKLQAEPKAAEEKLSPPMEEMLRAFFRRKAEAEADRTALSLGFLPDQTVRYRDFVEQRYRERANADSDEERARFRREDRVKREEFITSLIGAEGLDHYRALQQRRDEAALEKASGDALHTMAHTLDLTEEQKQELFQIFGAAARDDAAAGRADSFSLSFGYGMEAGPRLADDETILASILSPEQLAVWQRHGAPDPEMARKALGLVAPMVAGNPEIWKQIGDASKPATSPPSNE